MLHHCRVPTKYCFISIEMEIDIEQLIIEVSTFPELWDLSNENYKNKNKREEAWLQIITRIYGDFVENKSTLSK